MKKYDNLVMNAVGRLVPTEVNGQPMIPFMGAGKYKPTGKMAAPPIPTTADYPLDGNKLVDSLAEALRKCGLKDGMTISTHHHMRDGDLVSNTIFDIAHEMGIKNLVWFPSASFPCNEPMIKYLEDGTINRIEGSMNGPLGRFTSHGGMKGTAVLRAHGCRHQAVQDGEVHIDIAVMAAPTADPFGNANGLYGKSACGGLGFGIADTHYADRTIVVTDNLIPFPCAPMQIEGNFVDYVVKVDSIGIREKIVSGTTQITKSPDRLRLAEMTTEFCLEAGLIRDGFSFQAGAGGTSLSIGVFIHEILKKNGWKARFAVGGANKYLDDMLYDGTLDYVLDGQTFDLDAVRSMREDANHIAVSAFLSYNYHAKGNHSTLVDLVILGATEVDLNFNGNVVTHSDGLLLHGIGGWQSAIQGKVTILPIPLFRDRIPVIRDEVTTLCGPGEFIDVIVTERGIAINPLRTDLMEKMKTSPLPIKTLQELKEEAERICGKPQKPNFSDEIIAVIKWVDGTVIDVVRKVIS